jgi:hypothetical protein
MAADQSPPPRLTESQYLGLESRRIDDDRTLTAMHELEAALATAAPGREPAWRDAVLAALAVLEEVTDREQSNAAQPDSFLSDIARTQPRLRTRVRGLRAQYLQLQHGIASLRHELAETRENVIDFADLRQRLTWLLTALRHQQARESDLVYEAYYEAFNTDIAT